jgi:hypothetical protein
VLSLSDISGGVGPDVVDLLAHHRVWQREVELDPMYDPILDGDI